MKTLLLLIFTLCFSTLSYSQSETEISETEIKVEKNPQLRIEGKNHDKVFPSEESRRKKQLINSEQIRTEEEYRQQKFGVKNEELIQERKRLKEEARADKKESSKLKNR